MNLKAIGAMLVATSFFAATIVLAARDAGGLGSMARNIMEPVGLLSDFVTAACLIIGGSFLFASIIKYKEHRRSPLMVPISTVIFLVVAGLALIGLPFMWMLGKYVN
jgi:hypothetical protein